MIIQIYPLFERYRIMKKELLWSIRDYAYDYGRLMNHSFSNGILSGCEVITTDNTIGIKPGIIKFGDILYLINNSQCINYEPNECFQSLKIRFFNDDSFSDYIRHCGEIVLDNNTCLNENEIEICRFKLKKGFQLRSDYISFNDIQTEFDTVNLVNATFSAENIQSLSPVITKYFASEMLKFDLNDPWDINFCMICYQNSTSINRELISNYIINKLKVDKKEFTNDELFNNLSLILNKIQETSTLKISNFKRSNHQIFTD